MFKIAALLEQEARDAIVLRSLDLDIFESLNFRSNNNTLSFKTVFKRDPIMLGSCLMKLVEAIKGVHIGLYNYRTLTL